MLPLLIMFFFIATAVVRLTSGVMILGADAAGAMRAVLMTMAEEGGGGRVASLAAQVGAGACSSRMV